MTSEKTINVELTEHNIRGILLCIADTILDSKKQKRLNAVTVLLLDFIQAIGVTEENKSDNPFSDEVGAAVRAVALRSVELGLLTKEEVYKVASDALVGDPS